MKGWHNLGQGFSKGAGNSVTRTLEAGVHSISQGLMWLGISVFSVVILLIVSNVAMRYLFNAPITGIYDMVELAMLPTIFWAMVYVTFRGGNIEVALLVSRFPKRAQGIIKSVMILIGVGVFAALSWQLGLAGWGWMKLGRYSANLGVPLAPFKFVAALGAALICLELLVSFFHSLGKWK